MLDPRRLLILDAVVNVRAGRVRLAAFPSAGAVLVPPAVAAFRAAHPGVELSLAETAAADAMLALLTSASDRSTSFALAGASA